MRADAKLTPVLREARRQRRLVREFEAHVEKPQPVQPSSFGLTAEELHLHRQQLLAAGWGVWEIRARLTEPRGVAA